MKTLTPTSFILLFAGLVLLTTCKKPADQVLDGSARLRGTIYFTNYLTGSNDTAKTAVITLTSADNTANPYILTLTDGTYDIHSLDLSKQYTLLVTYDYRQPGSGHTDHYTGSGKPTSFPNGFLDNFDITLTTVATTTATLSIVIQDPNGANISGAQVCLYADANTLTTNQGNCTGSLFTGTTNANGTVVFGNLQQQIYYIAVNSTIGGVAYNNLSGIPDTVGIKQSSKITPKTISIKPVGQTLRFLVTDTLNVPLPNATVCIYSDFGLLQKNRGKCTGSLASSTTNAQGLVTFAGLSNVKYYASAYIVPGTDSLNNGTYDNTPYTLSSAGLKIDTLKLHRVLPASITALKITVSDQFQVPITRVSVCIYSDPSLLAKYRGTCAGSIYNGTTDINGNITFTGFQITPVNYYISAYKVVSGTDTLSNKANDINIITILPNQTKTVPITIK